MHRPHREEQFINRCLTRTDAYCKSDSPARTLASRASHATHRKLSVKLSFPLSDTSCTLSGTRETARQATKGLPGAKIYLFTSFLHFSFLSASSNYNRM
mmetsp:Transcript_18076/g.36679  ORF Transcript_18076/g.36679 Transcript_18076/m.36679 type:complete len:99 (+) Transcript_18076:387-683(+)